MKQWREGVAQSRAAVDPSLLPAPRRQEGGRPVLSHKMPRPLAEFSRGSSSKGSGTGEQGGFSAVGWDRPQGQAARRPESAVGWRGPLAGASQLPLVRAREWPLPPASLREERMEPHESQMRRASSSRRSRLSDVPARLQSELRSTRRSAGAPVFPPRTALLVGL